MFCFWELRYLLILLSVKAIERVEEIKEKRQSQFIKNRSVMVMAVLCQ